MRFIKNLTCWLLCVALVCTLCTSFVTVAQATDGDVEIPIEDLLKPSDPSEPSDPNVINSGSFGDLAWILYADGLLEISGSGAMPENATAPWSADRGLVKSVQIKDGVTSVSTQAFYNCMRMESVQLPNGLASIGYGAFAGCTSLKCIEIPETVTTIGAAAFGACSALESVVLPEALTVIEQRVFAQCTKLASVTIYDKLTTVEVGAFSGCDALKEVYFYGSADRWEQIFIADENQALLNATRTDIADEVVRGDMNGDGAVNDADALYLLRYTLFPSIYPIAQSGDMNADGVENDADALYLLRHTLFPTIYPLIN